MDNHLEENGNELPPIEDITTIPEEASEELREEEEAAAMEAALRTPEGPIINTEAEKPAQQAPPSQLSTLAPQEWVRVAKIPRNKSPYISLRNTLIPVVDVVVSVLIAIPCFLFPFLSLSFFFFFDPWRNPATADAISTCPLKRILSPLQGICGYGLKGVRFRSWRRERQEVGDSGKH